MWRHKSCMGVRVRGCVHESVGTWSWCEGVGVVEIS